MKRTTVTTIQDIHSGRFITSRFAIKWKEIYDRSHLRVYCHGQEDWFLPFVCVDIQLEVRTGTGELLVLYKIKPFIRLVSDCDEEGVVPVEDRNSDRLRVHALVKQFLRHLKVKTFLPDSKNDEPLWEHMLSEALTAMVKCFHLKSQEATYSERLLRIVRDFHETPSRFFQDTPYRRQLLNQTACDE